MSQTVSLAVSPAQRAALPVSLQRIAADANQDTIWELKIPVISAIQIFHAIFPLNLNLVA